jgi:hypothetical protein
MSEQIDHFALESCFPDSAAIFQNRYKSLDEIKSHCWVGLDTNVLLAPYRLDATKVEEIRPIYAALQKQKRLVVPGRVAREYARQRNIELANLVKALRDQSSRAGNPISKKIEFLRGDKDYDSILKFGDEIEQLGGQLQDAVGKLTSRLRDWATTDPVLTAYSEVFRDCIFDLQYEDKFKAVFAKELRFRFDHKIPPGYKDEKKPDGGSGDLIIWKTILLLGAKESGRDFLFVTGEEKNDWWIRTEGSFQPRYELMDEYRRASNGGTLHITHFPGFLRLFEAAPSLVDATEQAEKTADSDSNAEIYRAALRRRIIGLSIAAEAVVRELTDLTSGLPQGDVVQNRRSEAAISLLGQELRHLTGQASAAQQELRELESRNRITPAS